MHRIDGGTLKDIRLIGAAIAASGDLNWIGGPGCATLSKTLVDLGVLGPSRVAYGIVICDGRVIEDDHAWIVLGDGTIVDATISQFARWLPPWPGRGEIAVIPRGHAYAKHFVELRP